MMQTHCRHVTINHLETFSRLLHYKLTLYSANSYSQCLESAEQMGRFFRLHYV